MKRHDDGTSVVIQRPTTGWAPVWLAVAGPLVVLGVALAAVMAVDPARLPLIGDRSAHRERARAGHVMNGITFYTDVAEQLERDLKEYEPRVLIIGNSLANSNLDERVVARQLGIRPLSVGVVSVPNAISSHWYAILENRVFGANHHPELVIVVSSLQAMLVVEPYSDASRQALTVHLRDHEEVLDAYVDRGPVWLERWERQRQLWRQASLDGLRDGAVGLVFPGDGGAEAAMQRLFRDANLRDDPAADPGADPLAAAALLPVERSLFGPLTTLATDNGATIVFVRPPVAPRAPRDLRDTVPDGTAEAAAALVRSRGHVFLDEIHRRLPPGSFDNPRHMSEDGAAAFTKAIGPDLRSAWDGALGGPTGQPSSAGLIGGADEDPGSADLGGPEVRPVVGEPEP